MNALQELPTQSPPPSQQPAAPEAPPTPEQVDRLIGLYQTAQENLRTAEEVLNEFRKSLIHAVDTYGQVPPYAEQSRRLAGKHNIATVTRGTTVTVNEAAVYELKNYLGTTPYHALFPRFFAPQEKHVLVEGARDVLKTLSLPRRVEERIAALFGKAFDIKPKSPSLKVEIVKPEKPAKQPRGKKVA